MSAAPTPRRHDRGRHDRGRQDRGRQDRGRGFARLWRSTLFRFLLVGGCLALAYALLAALATQTLPGPRPLLAVLVWLACIPPAYWCQRRFTFRAKAGRKNGMALYAASQILGMAITALASLLLTNGQFFNDMLVYLGASALAAVASYLMARWVIFPSQSH